MRKLTLSLLLVVVLAVIGLGWGIDQWYSTQYAPPNSAVQSYKQMGREFIRLIIVAGLNSDQLETWAEKSGGKVQVIPYAEFPLPADLKTSFEQGEPLMLDSGSSISLHFFVASQQTVVSFNFPTSSTNTNNSRLSWMLTLLFYGGVTLIVLIWLSPLLKRLRLLRQQASAFGAGDLAARIPSGVSYIADIEQEFNRMAQRIESLVYDNKLLSRGLSHDLRTPIARLRFGLDVLSEAELSSNQQKTLAHLNRDLIAMESLVETLLSYARMDQAQITVKPALINLAGWVEDIIRDFYDNQITLDLTAANSPANILADPEYLNMLVHNLLQNAERHGHGKIIARVITMENQVILSVEDNGPGIPKEEREHVLKPFYRIASAKNTQGHGLGLAIVERIAQWHKARVELGESAELGGLKISVIFLKGSVFNERL